MKLLVVLLVVLYAHAINGQFNSSCDITILTNFTECFDAYLQISQPNITAEDTNVVCNTSCQMAIADFIDSCTNETEREEVAAATQASLTLGCIPTPNNGICFDRAATFPGGLPGTFITLGGVLAICTQEYIMGICSENCTQMIGALIDQLGCCFNEAIRVTVANDPDQASQDFSLRVLTSDYFTFCGLTAPMFCQDGPTVPPNRCSTAIQGLFGPNDACSNVARQIASGGDASTVDMADPACLVRLVQFASDCNISLPFTPCQMATVQVLEPNDNCSRAFPVLPTNASDPISFEAANVALNQVCGTPGCRDRLLNFARNCIPEEMMQRDMYELFVLGLGCRANDAGSCFAAQQSGVLDDVTAAFDLENGGICLGALLSQCSDECAMIVRNAIQETGCCVPELAIAGAQLVSQTINIDQVIQSCRITSPGRCPEQAEGTFRVIDNDDNDNGNGNTGGGGGGGGGAAVLVSYATLISLLALLPILII